MTNFCLGESPSPRDKPKNLKERLGIYLFTSVLTDLSYTTFSAVDKNVCKITKKI